MKIIRPKALFAKIGLSRSTVWRLERAGSFPKHLKLSSQAIGWNLEEIDAWLLARTTTST
ncbi:AlpA family phage regulatory protein [Janthinobacterium sp.]|uniref:helix-turn-helix transcriptional regulator n=1 Tax=Janthinobacterium sp. TaxID=1871054 RepID=UPI00341441CC|nr:AlpA family phage regulatory protein [Janthinobacterium sp.]